MTTIKRGIALLLSVCMILNSSPAVFAQGGDVPVVDSGAVTTLPITLNKSKLSLSIGESETLILLNLPENAQVQWDSTAPEVATVDETGLVSTVSEGEAIITATLREAVRVSCEIVVASQNPLTTMQIRSRCTFKISHLTYELIDNVVNEVDTGKKSLLFTLYGVLNTKPDVPSGYHRVGGYIAYGSSDNSTFYVVGEGSSQWMEIGEFKMNGLCGNSIWINGQANPYIYYKIVFGILASDDNVYGDEDDIFYPGDEIQFTRPRKSTGIIYKSDDGSGEWEPPHIPNDIPPLSDNDAKDFLAFLVDKPIFNSQLKNSDYYALLTGRLRSDPRENDVKASFLTFAYAMMSNNSTIAKYRLDLAITNLNDYLNTQISEYHIQSIWGFLEKFGKDVFNGTIGKGPSDASDILDNAKIAFNSIVSFGSLHQIRRIAYFSSYLNIRDIGINDHFNLLMGTTALELFSDIWFFNGQKEKIRLDRWAEFLYNLDENVGKTFSKQIIVSCPVEVDVFSEESLVISLGNDEVATYFTECGNFYITESSSGNYIKTIQINGDDYTFQIRGLNDGTMDYEIQDISPDGTIISYRANNISITNTTQIESTSDLSGDLTLKIDSDGDGITDSSIPLTRQEIVPIDFVTLDFIKCTLELGDTKALQTTISPANATNKNLLWSSSNSNVATVDQTGTVTAKSAGTTTITVTTEDGGKTATCELTVTEPSATMIAVDSVALDITNISFEKGTIKTLVATISPSNATNKNVTWSSKNDAVASVDKNGKITAKSAGTTTITVTTEDSGKIATCSVTVTKTPDSSNGDTTSVDVNEYDFWVTVEEQIKHAKNGVVKVNARGYDKMYTNVMIALRKKTGVTLVINQGSSRTIIIPAGKALADYGLRIYYPLSYLAEMYQGAKENVMDVAGEFDNPITGGVWEVNTPLLVQTDAGQLELPKRMEAVLGNKKTPVEQESEIENQSGEKISFAVVIAICTTIAIIASAGGFWFWKKKRR